MRPDRQELSPVGWRRNRRRARTAAVRSGGDRGQLLHWRPRRSRRRGAGRRGLGAGHGGLSQCIDADHRTVDRRGVLRQSAALLCGGVGNASRKGAAGWHPRPGPLLRGDRQAGRCQDAGQDFDQRSIARLVAIVPSMNPVSILQSLIRCPSVTPAEGGALKYLEQLLKPAGFRTIRLPFSEPGTADVDNLYARYGSARPHFCFAGHTDVVPPGREADWTYPPFSGVVADGPDWGRGAGDMK